MAGTLHHPSMRATSLILVISLLSLSLCGQQVVLTDMLRGGKDVADIRVIGSDATAFYVTEFNDEKTPSISFVAYSLTDSKELWRRKILLPSSGVSDSRYEQALHMKSGFLLFSTSFSEVTGQMQAYATMLNSKGEQMGDHVLVHYITADARSRNVKFDVRLSPDSSRMLLYFNPPYERKASENLSFKVYAPDLELMWEKDLSLPYAQDVVQVHNFIIDNGGHLYMMSGRSPEKVLLQNNPPLAQGGRYVLFHYNPTENKVKEYDVSLKDKQVIATAFALRADGSLVISGYYGNNYQFAIAGVFQFELNPEGRGIKTASFMPFPADFLGRFAGSREMVSKHNSLNDFYLDHVFPLQDGNTLLIGEQYYVEESVRFDPVTGRQIVEYFHHFDDIIVTKADVQGRILWCVKVPKQQYTSGKGGNCSYNCFLDEKLHLIFNDDDGNQERLKALPQGEALAWNQSKNSVTTLVEVSPEGTLTRKVLVQNKLAESLLAPHLGSFHPLGTMILGYDMGKSYRFGVVRGAE